LRGYIFADDSIGISFPLNLNGGFRKTHGLCNTAHNRCSRSSKAVVFWRWPTERKQIIVTDQWRCWYWLGYYTRTVWKILQALLLKTDEIWRRFPKNC